ncbi:hypothetical protein BKP64_05995 [Marinobacter salinus]|uniref:PAS domain-containing protein n=1 Tax=Marinobacter salinus TaxID=1874317 RepID=A0A1D9GJI5_9GAMM|nr:PAS domain-containing protein [Marinobacter salinus]AOY87759.1 hypothetical protein BKP64_05995 [Marinobacter salinus]
MNHSQQFRQDQSSQANHIAWNVLEATEDGIAVTNELGIVSYLNEAAEEILDISFGEALGEQINQILALSPLGPERSTGKVAPDGEFDAQVLKGLFTLRRRTTATIISIQVSEIGSSDTFGKEYVFIIRQLHDHSGLTNSLRASSRPINISTGHPRTVDHTLPPRERASARFSLTYLCLDKLPSAPSAGEQTHSIQDSFKEASKLIEKLMPAQAALYQIGKGESVLFMEESSQVSTIEMALRLIDVIRAKFQLSANHSTRIGLSAGVLIMPSNTSKGKTSLMVETARQLCTEARQLGNNAIQVCDLNAHEASGHRGTH